MSRFVAFVALGLALGAAFGCSSSDGAATSGAQASSTGAGGSTGASAGSTGPGTGGASSASSSSGAGGGGGGAGGGGSPTGCTSADGRALCRAESAIDWQLATLEHALAGASGVTLAATGLATGTDGDGIYNGGDYSFGSVTTGDLVPGMEFDRAVVSWNADTPAGSWVELAASARVGGSRWTGWYRLGVWASGTSDLERHSFEGESDGDGQVFTDTLLLDEPADAIRVRATLFTADGTSTPVVRRLAATLADRSAPAPAAAGGSAWGTILDVPGRSQMEFPDGGEVWCSPTSTSMVLAYWAHHGGEPAWELPVPSVVAGVWDAIYDGGGNWPFNVAFASSLGASGVVRQFASVADLEPWIAAGVPVVISAQWEPGDIDAAPIDSTDGHLLVVRGFDSNGDVAVNDPAAANDGQVKRVYARAQLAKAWLGGSGGIAYLMFPEGRAVPW